MGELEKLVLLGCGVFAAGVIYSNLSIDAQKRIIKMLTEVVTDFSIVEQKKVKGSTNNLQENSMCRPVLPRPPDKSDFGLCRLDGGFCRWDDCFCRRTEVCTVEVNMGCDWWVNNTWLNRFKLRNKKQEGKP